MECCECRTDLPCIQNNELCRECDEQFMYCFTKCKNPCRSKEEQKKLFDKIKPGWNKEAPNAK